MGQEPAAEPQAGPEPTPAPEPKVDEPKGDTKTFDSEYVTKLRNEAAASRKARQELEAKLNEYEERDKSELEKLTGKLTKAEQAKAEADARLLRYEVAQEKEVPAKLVPLLTATDKEGLEAQADLILENAAKPASPDFDGGAREAAPEPKSPELALNDTVLELFGVKPTN